MDNFVENIATHSRRSRIEDEDKQLLGENYSDSVDAFPWPVFSFKDEDDPNGVEEEDQETESR